MMRSLMLKSLMITSLLSTSIFANSVNDDKVVIYETKKITSLIKRNKKVKLNSMNLVLKKDLKQNGWFGYVFNLNLDVGGKKATQKHYVFSNGEMIAPDLININSKRSFRDTLYPKLSNRYFSKEHLIAGNPNAKHTLVIFSDPLCPICVDEVPMIMKNIIDNPDNIALYYYHMPLRMHPTASTLSKASMIASNMGIKNVDYRLYNANGKYFYGEDKDMKYDPYEERDHKKALDYFNKLFKTNITMAQIKDKKWEDKLKYDQKMAEDAFVGGTPTLFFDGEIDKKRDKYEKYLK
ncbi:MAG: thioredoxin domain-containing protein [Campylobacterota bacterium]|nr:thioredoxin domain-containing protein [Campylobacterota bacterium]